MIVLVCGGREFGTRAGERDYFIARMDDLHDSRGPITRIVEGGQTGADRMARGWAKRNAIPFATYKANWKLYGTHAGPIRNQLMLTVERPDIVIAFPGGPGTRNMIRLARRKGARAEVIVVE